jgi:hypothetical protein
LVEIFAPAAGEFSGLGDAVAPVTALPAVPGAVLAGAPEALETGGKTGLGVKPAAGVADAAGAADAAEPVTVESGEPATATEVRGAARIRLTGTAVTAAVALPGGRAAEVTRSRVIENPSTVGSGTSRRSADMITAPSTACSRLVVPALPATGPFGCP